MKPASHSTSPPGDGGSQFILRPVTANDYAGWRPLFEGYRDFYRYAPDTAVVDRVWSWLMDADHVLEGLVAASAQDERLVGLAHFRPMPSPGRGAYIGFLDDLFVDPAVRGGRLGARLIDAVWEIGRSRGWPVVRWMTADDNAVARRLYDRVATKTHWVLYQCD